MILDLAHWRALTSELYAAVRRTSDADPKSAWETFRAGRESMFREHPQSPLDERQKRNFSRLGYFPYDPRLRFRVPVAPLAHVQQEDRVVAEIGEGWLGYRPIAAVRIDDPESKGREATLTLYWLEGYGGGLFLPFRDATNGNGTYGGGRYLYDTIKGADLGARAGAILLDFNFAYNPSCAYNARWVCPLAPAANSLPFRVSAGELDFSRQTPS